MTRRLLVLALALATACGHTSTQRYNRSQAKKALVKLDQPGVVVGEFHVTKITDGDTIWVDGLDKSLRLLGIDTEEIFHHPERQRAVEADWDGYLKDMRGSSHRPVKLETPVGVAAMDWAKKWFDGVEKVRVERDHPAEIRDRYNRYLAYVVAEKNGVWLNYNVECVRAGWAPYFTKYGYSRRYHKEFLAALAEAKAAKRGIWAPNLQHAPDYAEREAWWNARGEFVEQFRKEGEGRPDYIDMTHFDAMTRLEEYVGKEVHVISTVDGLRSTKGPLLAMLDRLPLVFFDRNLATASGIEAWQGEYVVVTGTPTLYEDKRSHKKSVQIQIDRASQIKLSPVPGLDPPAVTASP